MSGDPVRLTQVFSNLLNNAAKFTESGGAITLECAQEGDAVVVTVSDTGLGISKMDLAYHRLRQRFHRSIPARQSGFTRFVQSKN